MPARSLTNSSNSERRGALRLHGTIARDIGVRIVSGKIAPGRVLEGEIEASERLKVSRTAYREAVRILAAKGLIESRPKLGTRVSEPHCWHLLDPDVISWIFTGTPDERLLRALFELRTIVEPAAAALAAAEAQSRSSCRRCAARWTRWPRARSRPRKAVRRIANSTPSCSRHRAIPFSPRWRAALPPR